MAGKNENRYLIYAVYIIGVIIYIGIVSNFTIPVHLQVDEELYISLARSFHYDGSFSMDGDILNYTCVLYSMIISLGYYFYTPENILFLFRAINVAVMLSSVFPTYFIGKMILKDNKKALLASVFLLFMPCMMDSAYCMQEVLAYPLFLWGIYFIFKEIGKDSFYNVSKNDFIIAIISALCYFTKTYMIFVPLVYCIFCVVNAKIHGNGYGKSAKKIAVFIAFMLILYFGEKCIVTWINDGQAGVNHYSAQFLNLFPISYRTVISAISCCIIYTMALLFIWGILPIVLPVYNIKNLPKSDKRYFTFVLISICVLIAEIVISIVLTEEGNVIAPSKICYRYFQIFEVPIILIFINNIKTFKIPKLWGAYACVLGILFIYFAYIGDRERHAIIDAPVLLLMENINKYIISGFNMAACVLAALLAFAVYLYGRKKKIDILRIFINFSIVFTVIFFAINLVQLPYYTNVAANGRAIQNDSIKIAHYLEDNDCGEVVFARSESDKYEAAVYAYLKCPVVYISDSDISGAEGYKDAVIITSAQNDMENLDGLESIEIETEALKLWKMAGQ